MCTDLGVKFALYQFEVDRTRSAGTGEFADGFAKPFQPVSNNPWPANFLSVVCTANSYF
jgi:hypothetical protein